MDLVSQPPPAPRQQHQQQQLQQQHQQQQLRDAHAEHEDSTLLPAASTPAFEIPGASRPQDRPRAADSSLHRPVTNASTQVGSTTSLTTGLPGQPRLNHSASHSHLQVRQHEQHRQSYAARFTNMRAQILRPHQSSSELSSSQQKGRLLPRSAGSSSVLRRPSDRAVQEREGAKSGPSNRNGDTVPVPKDVENIALWKKKLLNASKAARKGGRVEIDIIEALEPSQTKRKASASTLKEKGSSSNNKSKKQVGKKFINGGIGNIGGNRKVSLRSMRISPADSGSRGPSPSRAPSEPRPSTCKDNERSINCDLPLSINASHIDSFQEEEEEDGSLCSTPDTSILDSLPRQSDVNVQQLAPQVSPNATTDNYSYHEIEGPAIVVNHPVSEEHQLCDEPSTMDTTATSFQFSQFDYSEDLDSTTDRTPQEASGAGAHFNEPREIAPRLFDEILPHMHSPFVARYAHFDGNYSKAVDPHARLVAALPSRIVAQIASDSFMDYELVSDFFLTFRSYLDPQRLLQLLFARLEWSLDRKTADGRIVRIRTFAALRHWVLNYFVDDFMHENDGWGLRSAFCNRLNGLYRKVQARMSTVSLQEPETRRGNMKDRPAAVASDLKVLVDLKRCWIGRCALFCGSGNNDNSATAGISDCFNADQDIEPELLPQPQTYASQLPGTRSETQPAVKRLSRYTDVRFSHYGAFRPNDSTTLPMGSKTDSTTSFDVHFESLDKPLSLDGTRDVATRIDHPRLRRVGHVKTDSQSSTGSFQSTHSKRHADAKSKHSRNFSDSLRTDRPQVHRSLSTRSKPRPTSQNDLESLERRNHEVRKLESPVASKESGQSTLNRHKLVGMSQPLGSAIHQEKVLNAATDAIAIDALTMPQSLIRGTMFAPVDGVAHVLGQEPSTQPTRNTNGRQSPLHLLRPFHSHQDDYRRPRANGWKKEGRIFSLDGLRSSDDMSVLTTDTPKTPPNRESSEASESIPPDSLLLSPRRVGRSHFEASRRSTTLPVPTTIMSVTEDTPHLNSLRSETRPLIGEDHVAHLVSTSPGVKHFVGTLRRALMDRKHSNHDMQTIHCDGQNNGYDEPNGKDNQNWNGLPSLEDFLGEFPPREIGNHMHNSSGSSRPSQVSRTSFEPNRNWGSSFSRNNSPSADRQESPVSQIAASFCRHGGDASFSTNAPSSIKAPFATPVPVGTNGWGMTSSTSIGGYSARFKTLSGGLGRDDQNASLEFDTDEETRILRWLDNDKETRIDLLIENAAERYMDHFGQARDMKQQSRLSIATLMTPDASTRSIQIRTPCANEQTSEHILAEVQKARSKARVSDSSENHQPPNASQSSPPMSPISESNKPSFFLGKDQPKTQEPNSIGAPLVSQKASTVPALQASKSPVCNRSSTSPPCASLGFGLGMADRIPRRPSGQTPQNESTLSLGIPIPTRFPRPLGKSNKQTQSESPTPVPYNGTELATVDSGPSTERNSHDSHRSSGRFSQAQDDKPSALNVRKSECNERDSVDVNEADLERSLTNMTQATQVSQLTEHSHSKGRSKNVHANERGGAVARSMKLLGNRLRKYASYQSGMSKLNFRRHHDHNEQQDRHGDQHHGPSSSSGRMLPRWGKSKHAAHSDNVDVPGRVLEHRPLNVSSFDVNGRIEESDGEGAVCPPPLDDHSSNLPLSLPSPYLFQTSENNSRTDVSGQSTRAPRAHDGGHEQGSIPRGTIPLYNDTAPPVPVQSPYQAAEFAWRGFGSVDSLIESSFKADDCTVNSARDSAVQSVDGADCQQSQTLEAALLYTMQGNLPKDTDNGECNAADGSLSPKLANENGDNRPNGVEISLQPDAKWEQIPENTSPDRPTFFPRYSLTFEEEEEEEVISENVTRDDGEAVADGRCSRGNSIGSGIDGKPSDAVLTYDGLAQRNGDIDSETPDHCAQQDLMTHSPEGRVKNTAPLSPCLDTVRPGTHNESNLSRQNQTEFTSDTNRNSCSQPHCDAELKTGNSDVPSERVIPNDVPQAPSTPVRAQKAISGVGQNGSESKAPVNSLDYSKSPPPSYLTEHDGSQSCWKYQHAPFILAYDPKVLAEQLTLIEVSALSEIDWRDLVDMKWSNDQNTLDWAIYLSPNNRKGIDVVIARFNLMVKWIVSEVVLTRNVHERARAISKFIRIAVQARRMRNFSTMVQVTIALSSVDCISLKNTWALVDVENKRAFAEMELLVQPLRNFRDLRLEMESLGLHEGCVPFVGLYVQDLTYNAQKPSLIQIDGGTQPLVNLEKYRTSASIVKSLLRLIDASTRYRFTPVNGVIERCLWISCLKDEDIRLLSKSLEL